MTVIILDLRDLAIAQGHDEDVDDTPNGERVRKDATVAEEDLSRQLNPSHRKITMALLIPEPIIDL